MSPEPVAEWRWPPTDSYTADDLDRIPGLPPHSELIDGLLVVVSPQKDAHSVLVDVLLQGLRASAPRDEFRVRRGMSVVLGPRNRPEPDLIVLRADAVNARSRTFYPADAVVLAVEVVSPESEECDRKWKPQLYAQAGIPFFWRVEDPDGDPVVYAYERDPASGTYGLLGIFHERITLVAPFKIDIDLTGIDQL